MNLPTTQKYARDISKWLAPMVERCEISGSIRRQRPQCADVDLCIVPKTTVYKDMFGHVTGSQNHVWQHLINYVNNFPAAKLRPGQQLPKVLTGGDRAGHRMTLQLPGCQLDIWFATKETWACKLVNSTGSKEHNIWLAQRATDRGLHWFVSQGLAKLESLEHQGLAPALQDAPRRARVAGLILPADTETEFYGHLGLHYIAPDGRELAWLKTHIDSGL